MTSEVTISDTILSQLGGERFRVMTGARDFVSEDRGLSFRLVNARLGIKRVRVMLGADDLYTLECWGRRKDPVMGVMMPAVVQTKAGVGVDRLTGVFTEVTGLRTHL